MWSVTQTESRPTSSACCASSTQATVLRCVSGKPPKFCTSAPICMGAALPIPTAVVALDVALRLLSAEGSKLLGNSRVGPTSLRLWDATGSLTVSVGVVVSSQEKAIRDSVAVLSNFFVGEGTLGETLTRVANLAVACVGPAEMAGITMLVDGRVR